MARIEVCQHGDDDCVGLGPNVLAVIEAEPDYAQFNLCDGCYDQRTMPLPAQEKQDREWKVAARELQRQYEGWRRF